MTFGAPGRGFEVHEKISADGFGAICLFADGTGEYEYLTKNAVKGEIRVLGDTDVTPAEDGCLKLKVRSTTIIWSLPH